MTFFICGFPGIGKSRFYENFKHLCNDSDSSKYSKNKDGTQNPNFIKEYFEHLNTLVDSDVSLVFISTHEDVLNEMKNHDFKFTIVIPKEELKEEYLKRYKERGSTDNFISLIDANWKPWLDNIKANYTNYYELSKGETLTDYIVSTYESF